jgi:tetratricopeptide (TPR) repeat protein
MPAADRNYNSIRSLGVDYGHLGLVLFEQMKLECVGCLEQALAIFEELRDSPSIARAAGNIANVYLRIPELLDLDLAEKWLLTAIEHYGEDKMGRAKCIGQLAQVKCAQLDRLLETGTDREAAQQAWSAASALVSEMFRVLPDEAIRELAVTHDLAAHLYRTAGETDLAMSHYQQMIKLYEDLGQPFMEGAVRLKAAQTLAQASRYDDAALFAEQATQDFEGSGAPEEQAVAQHLLDQIRAAKGQR